MKTRIIAIVLAAIMLCAIIPFTASAAGSELYVGGVRMYDGDYLATGSLSTVKTQPDSANGFAYYKNGVLTLCNYEFSGAGYYYSFDFTDSEYYYSCLYSNGDLEINLVGNNYLKNTNDSGDGITVFGNLTIDGDDDGELAIDAYYGIYAYTFEKDVLFTINGGNLNVYAYTCVTVNGFDHSSSMVINSGSHFFDSTYSGITVYGGYDATFIVNGGENIVFGDVIVYSDLTLAELVMNRGVLYVSYTDGTAIYVHTDGTEYPEMVTVNGGDLTAYGGANVIQSNGARIFGGIVCLRYDSANYTNGSFFSVDPYIAPEVEVYEGSDLFMSGVYESGDVNADGTVDTLDYLFVKRYCFGSYDLWGTEYTRANINNDDAVDSIDYVLIKRICFGSYAA